LFQDLRRDEIRGWWWWWWWWWWWTTKSTSKTSDVLMNPLFILSRIATSKSKQSSSYHKT